MIFRTSVDVWAWWTPCPMMYETPVDRWDRWRTPYSRWCAKQMLMDETDVGLHIPDDGQINCWWVRLTMFFIPDDVWNNCRWIRPMRNYTLVWPLLGFFPKILFFSQNILATWLFYHNLSVFSGTANALFIYSLSIFTFFGCTNLFCGNW